MRIPKRASLLGGIAIVIAISSCRSLGDPPAPIVLPGAASADVFIAPATIEIARGFQSSEIVSARLVNGQAADVSWTIVVVTEQPPTKFNLLSAGEADLSR